MKRLSFVITVVMILTAFSGWGTLMYNWMTSKPKIRGYIFAVITGTMPNPTAPNQTLTAFLVYLYLTNVRKNSAHILDYELEIDTGAGYEKMERVYQVHRIKNWGFGSPTHIIEIPNLAEKLIYAKGKPIEYGTPLHGFVLFASKRPKSQFNGHVKRYKVTCVDVFLKRHEVFLMPPEFRNLYLLEEMAGIKLIPKREAG